MSPEPIKQMPHTQFSLLKTRRFAPFFVTQFLGAFNDNLFKNALVVLLTFHAANWTTLSPEILTNLAAGIFILPFFVFSATAGQLADKIDKAKLARLVKLLEMLIMGVATIGFLVHSLAVLLGALALLGLHSTLFGPVKYAILPQHLSEDELVGGNALVETGTFVAILIGTLAGGLLASAGGHPAWVALAALLVAALGFISSLGIPAARAPVPDLRVNLNPFSETWRNVGFARRDRTVFLAIVGISWFWLYGALFLAQFPVYAKNVLGGSETTVTLLLAIFTVGIGLGSMLCEKLSGKRVEIGLVPFGSIGLTVFAVDLVFASPVSLPAAAPLAIGALLGVAGIWRVLFDLFALGLFGGFFIVPLYVLIQLRSAPEHRARIIAANNILNALFMVAGALVAAALLGNGLTIPRLFGIAALCNALVAVYIYSLLPEFFVRFLAWLLVHSRYRLEVAGDGMIPHDAPALLACTPVGLAGQLAIVAASRRPIRFVVAQRAFGSPLAGFLLRRMRAIAMASGDGDSALQSLAHEQIARALEDGELVGVLSEAEGVSALSPDITAIVARTPVAVIPLTLRVSPGGRADAALPCLSRWRPFARITLQVGQAVFPDGRRARTEASGKPENSPGLVR